MSQNNYQMNYGVDVVFCIDCTGSMKKALRMVKENALSFYKDVMDEMQKKGKIINEMRVRVIAFRDYLADKEKAMLCTDFFNLPAQKEAFDSCVKGLIPEGGGDIPEDALEALAYAIRSDWGTGGKRRSIIVLWTDAPAHPLGYAASSPLYDAKMARDFSELTEWWGDEQNPGYIDSSAKRLLLYAPESEYWDMISDNWDNVIHFQSKAGEGLEEFDYREILGAIASSI